MSQNNMSKNKLSKKLAQKQETTNKFLPTQQNESNVDVKKQHQKQTILKTSNPSSPVKSHTNENFLNNDVKTFLNTNCVNFPTTSCSEKKNLNVYNPIYAGKCIKSNLNQSFNDFTKNNFEENFSNYDKINSLITKESQSNATSNLKNFESLQEVSNNQLQVPLPLYNQKNYLDNNSELLKNVSLSPLNSTTSNNSQILDQKKFLRRLSNSPLNSFTKLNNIRKKSVSEISLILEVIRSAAIPNNVNSNNYDKMKNRVTASASPLPRKSFNMSISNKFDSKKSIKSKNSNSIERVSLSTGNLILPQIANLDNEILKSNYDKNMKLNLIRNNSNERKIYKKVSITPPQTFSKFSSFICHKKSNAKKIKWERLSPYYIQKQLSVVQEEKAMQMAPTAPINATKFVAYVQERKKKQILFKGEYLMVLRSIDTQKCSTSIAVMMGDRNQYADTLPYDHNRVILKTNQLDLKEPYSGYINASYIQSWLNEKAYVVTQAMKTKQASNDFWRLVWELQSNCIVMLTKVFDFMRVMCLQYWPIDKLLFDDIEVDTLETKSYAHFVVRTFCLKRVNKTEKNFEDPNKTRIVKHFHFTEWELNSFPYISAFIELRRRVRQWTDQNQVNAPIVVHCSNGGGRSGAFLAVDANLELLQKTNQVDVFEYAKILVNSRQHLIDSVEQYMFIYDVLCEALLCNIQPIAMHQLKDRSSMYKSKKDRELMELQDSHENKLLLMLTPTLRIGDCAGGHRLENRGKNRDVMVVPPDYARPYLQTLHGESKDYTYINAVEVDGFTRKKEFIVTEWPKQQTLDSFWTLVFDHSVHTVINLTNQQTGHNNKIYPPFIHSKGKKNYGPFMVEILNYQQYPGLTSYMVKITKRLTENVPIRQDTEKSNKEQVNKLTFMISEIMASGASQQQIEAEIRICCVIQVKMWPIENKVPLSTSSLIDLLRMSRSWRKRAPDRPETKPTIVMSHNGISRCGIFIGANVCIDEMDMDHEVDVFHAVKMIRLNRPQLIDMKDEYKYLYDLMLHWYMNNPEYRVYEPPDNKQISSLNCYENEILHEAVDENESLTLNDSSQNNLKNQSFRQKSFCSHQQKDLNCTNFLKKTSSDTPKTIYLN